MSNSSSFFILLWYLIIRDTIQSLNETGNATGVFVNILITFLFYIISECCYSLCLRIFYHNQNESNQQESDPII